MPTTSTGRFGTPTRLSTPGCTFDIQLFYFAHDTPREMGGTMFLPGSHYRRISESDIARYQNFLGQMPMVCKAGTVAVAHHGIWHCAQPNLTGRKRYMFKLRAQPHSAAKEAVEYRRYRRCGNPRAAQHQPSLVWQRGALRSRQSH